MNQLSQDIKDVLADAIYLRSDPSVVGMELKRVGVNHSLLQEFFEHYEGPFWSEYIGCELMDICADDENIVSATEICRKQFGFSIALLVLTRLTAGQVVVLDCVQDKVYEVDFEGGDRLLLSGQLTPRWESFSSFLDEYFTGN